MHSFTMTHVKILYHHFTPAEVHALYRLIEHEVIPRHDEEIVNVVNRIADIVRADELAKTNHKTT